MTTTHPLPSTLGAFEGVNVFDISDRSNPDPVANVGTLCGSHTLTIVPDLNNDRVLVYSNPSSTATGCTGIDIIDIPIDDPAAASYLRLESSGGPGDVPAPRKLPRLWSDSRRRDEAGLRGR